MNLNKVYLIGRLTQNPEMRTTPSGQNVCNFGLATNRTWTDQSNQKQEKAEFHNIVLWGKLADVASRYLTKGGLVLIEGRLQTRSWQDQQGQKKYRTEIVTENMQLGPRFNSPNAAVNPVQPAAIKVETETLPEVQLDEPDNKSTEEINIDNIPF